MTNKFLVSVADAVLRDPNTLEAIAVGKTNMTSSITLTMQKTEVRGGINNPLLYTYFHDRNAEFKIEQVTFGKDLLALNLGTSIVNGTYSVVKSESLVLSGGSATCTETPTGDVTVFLPNGTVQTVTPTGAVINVAGGTTEKVNVVYVYSETDVDQIVATSTTPPTVVDLTLIAEVRDETGVITDYLQVNVPRYQVSGNYTLSLAANGVSQESLDGVALVTTSTDSSADYYFKANWIPASGATAAYTTIAATPTVITFSNAVKPDTEQINVLGIRGGLYSNVNITSSASFARISGCTTITTTASGLVTGTSAIAASHNALIGIWYWSVASGSLSDLVNVYVTA